MYKLAEIDLDGIEVLNYTEVASGTIACLIQNQLILPSESGSRRQSKTADSKDHYLWYKTKLT